MTWELSARAANENRKTTILPQLVLEIDGLSTVFGASAIQKLIQIGDPDLLIGDSWVIGGFNDVADQRTAISLDGTGTSISQQLRQDEGSVSSVSSITVELLDTDDFMTQVITPGLLLEDILGRTATLWLGFKNSAFKQDYIRIFGGQIDDIVSGAGTVKLNLVHPDSKKRQQLFPRLSATTSGSINNSVTTIPISDANLLFETPYSGPIGVDPALKYYVRIEDEIIRYTGVTSTHLTGCSRAQLGTLAASHGSATQVDSFYVLEGAMVDLSLKLMLSGTNGYFKTGVAAERFNQITALTRIDDSLFFPNVDIRDEYGLIEGDYFTVSGATNTGNNVVMAVITAIVSNDDGSYLTSSGIGFIDEIDSAASVSFRSQYDTMGIGLGMKPSEVDVAEHHYWRDLFLAEFDYRFYIRDAIDGKDFIEKQIYAPYGAYSLPRQARASMGFTLGPVPRGTIKTLNKSNIKHPGKVTLRRTKSRFYANTLVYAYDDHALESVFKKGKIYVSGPSLNRIPGGVATKKYEALGARSDLSAVSNTEFASTRIFDLYQYAAEWMQGVGVLFKAGFNVEPGDLVLIDFDGLRISNTVDGTRDRPNKFFQVTNKSLDLRSGDVTLDLLDTNFDSNQRFGLISPSSLVVSGTDSYALIEDSFGALYPGNEPKKWEELVGLPVLVHNDDFSFSETTTFTGFDPVISYRMLFDPPLSAPVQAGWVIDIAPYSDSADRKVDSRYKVYFAHFSARVAVVSGVGNTEFVVDPADIDRFQVGFPVLVHTDDFGSASLETKVTAIVGDNVTVESDLGFTPDNTYFVSMLGFADGDHCYRLV